MTNEVSVGKAEVNSVTEVLPAKKKGGRPGKWDEWLTEDGLLQVTAWAKSGLFIEQISKNMGITTSTFYDWQNRFPELSSAIKDGRAVVDQIIENAMFKRATGYEHVEETMELNEDGIMMVVKRVRKTEAPNTAAQIFWMKNRRPEEWRDKVDISNEHSGTIRIELGEQEKWSE